MGKTSAKLLPIQGALGGVLGGASKNLFCKKSNLTNEASVEKWFIDPLLEYLGFGAGDQLLKTSIRELKVGKGSKSLLYKPDYVVMGGQFPALVIDAKAPDESVDDWVQQCRSYCLEINAMFEHNPVEYFMLSNGHITKLFRWDNNKPLLEMLFDEATVAHPTFVQMPSPIC